MWEAYQQVKANRGAAGVDGQSMKEFEADLKNNLYRIWNRMSSGSYMPPPVLRVDIPKDGGAGTRPLGIPTISDRVAQTVVKRYLEPLVEPVFHRDSYGYRPGRSVRRHTDCAWVLLYIERWLKAPVQMPDGTVVHPDEGTPQGGVVTPATT
ncbi:Retron-type RNA-directed DNA polymerase (plasmid) [Cupriavidus necator H850]|nr:Retron-type RNA-directed DNA polymerase [Cupriavidus necator H850]